MTCSQSRFKSFEMQNYLTTSLTPRLYARDATEAKFYIPLISVGGRRLRRRRANWAKRGKKASVSRRWHVSIPLLPTRHSTQIEPYR